ncbi:hypothetical protein [Alienimonas chondri]|uniref:Outer membrane lipoprotein carrier protein LolA n=1 Tax=Alienimonas chondri TaxID=2681879 RepID=A0ABX1VHB6_9PLAN|nr:hypothetical protein [Alienimonas chondri]NNJ26642.1 hypothetical protein [Alienimonas chondri]
MRTACLPRLAPLAALASLALSAAPLLADHHEGEGEATKAPDLRGSYTIVGGEKFGEEIPAENLKDNRVVITADTFAVVDKDSKNLYASTYQLMPAKDLKLKNAEGVWFADLVSKLPKAGSTAPALIRVRMKKVKEGSDKEPEIAAVSIIYSLSEYRPTKFKTGPKDLMFRLKKETKPAEVEADAAGEAPADAADDE